MTETVAASAPVATTVKKSPAKKKAAGAKAKGATAAHPATSVMVVAAIKELNEKKGSSLPAIKKYLAANYKVDPVKLAPFIRKFLKASVVNKTIVQTKGTGASGHFKLATAVEAKPKKKIAAPKKKLVAKKAKVPGSPKKKKSVVKKAATKSASGEPATKKVKKAPAPKLPKASKPKKPTAASKAKKIAAKKPTTPKKK